MRFSFYPGIILFLLLPLMGGCAKLAHLRELLVLNDYSKNKDLQEKAVQDHDARFRRLLAAVQADELGRYPDQRAVLFSFGDPLLRRPVARQGTAGEQWLYRRAVKYFDSAKVYLYFDGEGRLTRWEYVPAPDGETATGTPGSGG